jgi:hypothetical protein
MKSSTSNLNSRKSEVGSQKSEAAGRKLLILVACGLFFGCGCVNQKAPQKVYIKKLKASHYQLIVAGKPYVVKGVCYPG